MPSKAGLTETPVGLAALPSFPTIRPRSIRARHTRRRHNGITFVGVIPPSSDIVAPNGRAWLVCVPPTSSDNRQRVSTDCTRTFDRALPEQMSGEGGVARGGAARSPSLRAVSNSIELRLKRRQRLSRTTRFGLAHSNSGVRGASRCLAPAREFFEVAGQWALFQAKAWALSTI
jgi:hypothetical protein